MSNMSRNDAIDWLCRLRSSIVTYLPKNWHGKITEALNFAIDSLKVDEAYQLIYEEPDLFADCISRKDVLNEINRKVDHSLYAYKLLMDCINKMPSVLPKAKKGQWKILPKSEYDSSTFDHIECTNCGKEPYGDIPFRYCPNCGSMMSKEIE